MKILISKLLYNIMGTIQILNKCCNDDFEIDEDDDEKNKTKPIIQQQPTLTKTRDKSTEVINDEADSFTTTIPCFPTNN